MQRELDRIERALDAAEEVLAGFDPGRVEAMKKAGGDPVTAADLAIDGVLKEILPESGEGWLSEETVDDPARLAAERVWIVDPLDGTKEFVEGLPEFCVSIALVIGGRPAAGGISNPVAGVRVVGAAGHGVRLNGASVTAEFVGPLDGARVLASRSEVGRGQWAGAADLGVEVVPMGSVAYKMARVSAGLDAATWTLVPKHEWDVAGGAALLAAGGGTTVGMDGRPLAFNQPKPWYPGAIAVPPGFEQHVPTVLGLR